SAAERTATESEARLAAALATSTDPMLVVDQSGRVISANRIFVALVAEATGMEVRLGMPITDVMDEVIRDFWDEALPHALAGNPQVRSQRFVFPRLSAPRAFTVRFT